MEKSGEQIFASALCQVAGVGTRLLIELKTHFGSYSAAWDASAVEWLDVPGVTAGLKDRFDEFKSSFDIEEYARSLSSKEIKVLAIDSPNYPEILKQIASPPPVIYLIGNLQHLEPDKVAIVGTRKASEYGKEVARKLARDLVDLGLVVVSGMALGIDGSAHEGAIDGGGPTIAVLGSGVDVVYPDEHVNLYREIRELGLIISEQPPGSPPLRENFPSRNRIISGLCVATVVVEAPLGSGALLTAHYAIEQGRDVFAVPGSVNSYSFKGNHKLIKDGAKLIEDVDDIVTSFRVSKFDLLKMEQEKSQRKLFAEEVRTIPFLEETLVSDEASLKRPKTNRARRSSEKASVESDTVDEKVTTQLPKLTEEELSLLSELSYSDGTHINNLARKLKLSMAELSARLTLLEIKGLVKSLPGGFYLRL